MAWRGIIISILIAVVAVGLFLAPLHLGSYWLRVLSMIFMYATLAQAINLIAGFTGYPAFGNVVFFGLGAYAVAITMVKMGGGFFIGLLIAPLLCAAVAVVLGPALLRLRGHYFAIATVGLNEAVRAVVSNLTPLTGGGMGLSLPLPPWPPLLAAKFFYYLLLLAAILSIICAYWFRTSRIGYAARAIRDDEVKAAAMGLRTTTVKTLAWAISAALTGLVGGIYAYWFSYIDPPAVFSMLIAVKAFVIFLFGGAATVLGPFFSAFVIEGMATFFWSQLLGYHMGVLGFAIMLIALFMPDGLTRFIHGRIRGLSGWGR